MFLKVIGKSALAGLVIGALQGFVGYVPRIDSLLITGEAGIVGGAVGCVLGALLYPVFDNDTVIPAFKASALVAGTLGIAASVFLRWWTRGEGATLSAFLTPPTATIVAIAIRVYLYFKKTSLSG